MTQIGATRRARAAIQAANGRFIAFSPNAWGTYWIRIRSGRSADQLPVEPAEATEAEPVRQPADPDPGSGRVRAETLGWCVHRHLVSHRGKPLGHQPGVIAHPAGLRRVFPVRIAQRVTFVLLRVSARQRASGGRTTALVRAGAEASSLGWGAGPGKVDIGLWCRSQRSAARPL